MLDGLRIFGESVAKVLKSDVGFLLRGGAESAAVRIEAERSKVTEQVQDACVQPVSGLASCVVARSKTHPDFPEPTAEQMALPEVEQRRICDEYGEKIYEAARRANDELRASVEFWVGSWDSAPRFARMNAVNAALAKFGLPPKYNIEEEHARPRGRGVVMTF